MTTPPTATDVDHPTVPAPLTTRTNLLVCVANMWYRSKVEVNRLLGSPPPEICTAQKPTSPLPYEIIEMVIAHLIDDIPALKASSLTCRSWYIVTTRHIHHTLVLGRGFTHDRLKPLFKLHSLGLIPLIQEIRVERPFGADNWFVPRAFSKRTLRYFSAFANVHTLGLQRLEISQFFPHIERYFGQFSPTLRSIALFDPRCTPRQLSRFLSLFSNLNDIKIWGPFSFVPNTTVLNATPIPLSTPPKLRGRLTLGHFGYTETWTHFIALCGGLRFRRMELFASASCAPVLLDACAETLETLHFDANDPSQISFPKFDLSQLDALRSLQVVARVGSFNPPRDLSASVMDAFSTIASQVFFKLVIILSNTETASLPNEAAFFLMLRKVHKVRPFELVFLLEGPRSVSREERWELAEAGSWLKETVDYVVSKGFLDFLHSPPTIRTIPGWRYYDSNFSSFD